MGVFDSAAQRESREKAARNPSATSLRPRMDSWGKDEVGEWAVNAIPSSLIHHSAVIAALDSEDIDGPALVQLGASAITAQQALGIKFGAASALVNAVQAYKEEQELADAASRARKQ